MTPSSYIIENRESLSMLAASIDYRLDHSPGRQSVLFDAQERAYSIAEGALESGSFASLAEAAGSLANGWNDIIFERGKFNILTLHALTTMLTVQGSNGTGGQGIDLSKRVPSPSQGTAYWRSAIHSKSEDGDATGAKPVEYRFSRTQIKDGGLFDVVDLYELHRIGKIQQMVGVLSVDNEIARTHLAFTPVHDKFVDTWKKLVGTSEFIRSVQPLLIGDFTDEVELTSRVYDLWDLKTSKMTTETYGLMISGIYRRAMEAKASGEFGGLSEEGKMPTPAKLNEIVMDVNALPWLD